MANVHSTHPRFTYTPPSGASAADSAASAPATAPAADPRANLTINQSISIPSHVAALISRQVQQSCSPKDARNLRATCCAFRIATPKVSGISTTFQSEDYQANIHDARQNNKPLSITLPNPAFLADFLLELNPDTGNLHDILNLIEIVSIPSSPTDTRLQTTELSNLLAPIFDLPNLSQLNLLGINVNDTTLSEAAIATAMLATVLGPTFPS